MEVEAATVTAAGEEMNQFGASTSDPMMMTIRGKRTKRHRSASPDPLKAATSSSNSGVGGERSASSAATTTTSGVYESSTEEEEDMANCLILLAQGRRRPERKRSGVAAAGGEMSSRRFSDIATTTNKAGFFVYECKTCNRSFPSFQALGGHRASHKKPRPAPLGPLAGEDIKVIASTNPVPANLVEIENNSSTAVVVVAVPAEHQNHTTAAAVTAVGTPAGNKVAKVHECAICGAEFTSGQALGGHMRRHRASNAGNHAAAAAVVTATAAGIVDTSAAANNYDDELKRNVLPLDLNLPAPEDLESHHHHRGDQSSTKFQFASKKSPAAMVFSAPALVGCHY